MGFFKRFQKPKAKILLTVSETDLKLGDDLKGVITVTCKEEFDATEVRAELRCTQQEKRREYNKQLGHEVTMKSFKNNLVKVDERMLSGRSMHIIPGFKKEFPFTVHIPAGGRETLYGENETIEWSLKGVIGIKGRPDVTSDTIKLRVTKPSAMPTAVKVVMIPCQYCNTPVPETATECPKCGASDFNPQKSSG